MFLQLVVVLLGVWMPLVRSQAGSECVEDRTQAISVVLNGARNLTGSWISEVVLRRSEEQSSTAQAHTWAVQVEPRTFKCGADKTALEVSLTFIGQTLKSADFQGVRPPGIKSASITTTPEPSVFSRADYELVPGQGHYKFHLTPVSWTEARAACAEEGSHLMILDSNAELEIFKKLFARQLGTIPGASGSTWAWLGVYKPLLGTTWETVLGGPLNITSYARWYSGRPGKDASYDYVLGFRTSGEFHDNPIWVKYPFICEHQL